MEQTFQQSRSFFYKNHDKTPNVRKSSELNQYKQNIK